VAAPDNAADVMDRVVLTWLAGGAYDSVRVARDGVPVTVLPGAALTFSDFVDRGSYSYAVTGWVGGTQSAAAAAPAFAGLLTCHLEEDLEAGVDDLELDSPWGLVPGPAAGGLWSLTDSPSGSYANNRDIAAAIVVPSLLTIFPRLGFDHICITEAGYDFGIVEISTDFGNTWSELARYDQDDQPAWQDGTADPGDWVRETIDLNPYIGKKVTVRFRLVTDASVVADGWYLDNIAVSDTACAASTGTEAPVARGPLLRAGPNPFVGSLGLAVDALPGADLRLEVFDVAGRRVRVLHEGPWVAGPLAWDGRDEARRPAAAGVYLVRAAAGTQTAVRRVVKLAR
jgi:bacillopeptidase F